MINSENNWVYMRIKASSDRVTARQQEDSVIENVQTTPMGRNTR